METQEMVKDFKEHASPVSQWECLGGHIIVKLDMERGEFGTSGLIKPDTLIQRSQEGTVVLCGPGEYQHGIFVPLDFQIGQRVLVTKYGGTEITLDQTYHKFHYTEVFLRKKM